MINRVANALFSPHQQRILQPLFEMALRIAFIAATLFCVFVITPVCLQIPVMTLATFSTVFLSGILFQQSAPFHASTLSRPHLPPLLLP